MTAATIQRSPDNPGEAANRPDPRTPPQDVAAEQSVLGGMLLSKDAVADVVEILRAADFYRPAHADVFATILDLHEQGEPADAITVGAALAASGKLARIGGLPYLHTLIATVPTASNAGYYARIVADKAVLRRLIEASVRVSQMAYAGTEGDADTMVDRAQQVFYDLEARPGARDVLTLANLMQPTLDEIEQAGSADRRGVPSGFTDLDRLIGGAQPGQLIVIGGRPAMGKSALGLNWAEFAAINRSIPAVFFTLEMGAIELTTRVLSSQARVPLQHLRNGTLSDDDWAKLARSVPALEAAPLLIDDSAMTLAEIRAKARRLRQRNNLGLVVVDYLQLMASTKRVESRQQEVADLSRGLKLMAKELEVPVIAMSQLNRGVEGRQDKRPGLADLRESGAVEQDSDVVILLHRDDYYDKESPRAGEADFIVAKHRNGPTDTITVAAQLHFSRFVDMAIS